MIAAIDVQYETNTAHAGIVLFSNWNDAAPFETDTHQCVVTADYVPGEFYQRELPVLTPLIDLHRQNIQTLVVDSYVDLDATGSPGLGRYLFEHYGSAIPVVGVAKSRFRDSNHAVEICRGNSRRPLFVTAAGISVRDAADKIQAMAGLSRLPTLIKLADSIARNTNHA